MLPTFASVKQQSPKALNDLAPHFSLNIYSRLHLIPAEINRSASPFSVEFCLLIYLAPPS